MIGSGIANCILKMRENKNRKNMKKVNLGLTGAELSANIFERFGNGA